jgi:ribosome-associated toxin RatA of RatAB toxin-antitoxin module
MAINLSIIHLGWFLFKRLNEEWKLTELYKKIIVKLDFQVIFIRLNYVLQVNRNNFSKTASKMI